MAEPRKRTNAEIDNLNQFVAEGETPLPYELDENNNPIELTEDQKLAAQEKIVAEQKIKDEAAAAQKVLDDAAESENQKVIAETTPAPKTETTPTPVVEAELDDEKVLAYLKNKKGKEVTSLDEFLNPKAPLTAEEKKVAAEQRDGNKIAYGLQKGIITKNELEEFITDTKNPKDLVYSLYVKEQKEKDEELSDAEIKAEFEEKFGLDKDEESRQYQAGQNLLNNIADNIIRKKHEKILNLENVFSSYESTQSKQQEQEQKVLAQAPLYKKDVEEVRNEIKKVSIEISDKENFEIPIDEKIVNEIISSMLEEKYAQQQIANGWSKENLQQGAKISAIIKDLPNLLTKYADAKILATQAGVRGIPPSSKQPIREGDKPELTDRQKVMRAHFFKEETIAN